MKNTDSDAFQKLPARLRPASQLLIASSLAVLFLACSPTDPVERAKAVIAEAQGQFSAQTIESLRELLAESPDDPEMNYLYGKALSLWGEAGLAQWALRKAALDPEWRTPAASQIAKNAARTGNYETTIEFVSKVLEEDPDNVDLLILRANAGAASRIASSEALADTDRVLKIAPDNARAMEPRILALLNLERYEEAGEEIKRLGQMIEANPGTDDSIRGWHCTTTALYASDSGETELALELFNECLLEYPGNPNLINNAVSFFDERGEYARSLKIIQDGLEKLPESLDYRRQIAVRLVATGDTEAAEQVLIGGTEVASPAYAPAAWQFLAKHYQEQGQHQQAIQAFAQAIEITQAAEAPTAQLMLDYADSLILGGDLDQAMAVTDQMAVKAHAEIIRARIAQERGDHQQALEHFDRAFQLWPDNPWARYSAALSAEQVGDFDRAADEYRYAIRIDGQVTDAQTRLARMLIAEGDMTTALNFLAMQRAAAASSLDGLILLAELYARGSQFGPMNQTFLDINPYGHQAYGKATATVGQAIADEFGAEAAIDYLENYGANQIANQDPTRLPAARKLIELRFEIGHVELAQQDIEGFEAELIQDKAVAAALRGYGLEQIAAEQAMARTAYEEALKADPRNPDALAGLGRILSTESPRAALAFYDRAIEAEPDNVATQRAAARLLRQLGETEQARDRLQQALATWPYSGPLALDWAELESEATSPSTSIGPLIARAERFRSRLTPEEAERLDSLRVTPGP